MLLRRSSTDVAVAPSRCPASAVISGSVPAGGWVVEGLESALREDDPLVRRNAARSLASMRSDAVRALPTLARISLADLDSGVRAAAVNALTDIGAPEALVLANAIELLGHPDQTVRARAAWAIGKLDPEVAAMATPQLSELLATDPAIDARFGRPGLSDDCACREPRRSKPSAAGCRTRKETCERRQREQ